MLLEINFESFENIISYIFFKSIYIYGYINLEVSIILDLSHLYIYVIDMSTYSPSYLKL